MFHIHINVKLRFTVKRKSISYLMHWIIKRYKTIKSDSMFATLCLLCFHFPCLMSQTVSSGVATWLYLIIQMYWYCYIKVVDIKLLLSTLVFFCPDQKQKQMHLKKRCGSFSILFILSFCPSFEINYYEYIVKFDKFSSKDAKMLYKLI